MKRSLIAVFAPLLAVALATTASADSFITVTSITITAGKVTVHGKTALPVVAGIRFHNLVADAGDTAFVRGGQVASLIGTAYGGTAPYTFSWSTPIGKLVDGKVPTALLDTGTAKPGSYPVLLTVTDAAGKKATDTVKVVVFGGVKSTLLDESKNDALPGVTTTGTVQFTFKVPERIFRFDVRVTWDNPVNDYDLTVIAPDGSTQSGSGGTNGEPETATITDPKAGTWTLSLDKYATVGDTLHAVVSSIGGPADPRPSVDSGGPYRFLLGSGVNLAAKVAGGTKPVRVGWDTDGDGVVDRKGTNVSLRLPEGRHLVTVYAVDAKGLERRQTTSVLVATKERLKLDTAVVTVIGIADSGINAYHQEYSAATYPDPDVLALTKNFTRHPSSYIPGYPADAQAIPITIGKGYFPAQDKHLWDGNKTIEPGKLYWIPGTKIIGATTTETVDVDPHPILDDEGHGTGTTSVAAGNRYGYCPTCLLMFVEGLGTGIKEAYPWVDISSNSFGPGFGLPTGLTGSVLAGTGPDLASKAAVERGQTVLFAAGNGLGNFFDVPQADWGEAYTGMDWNITVGALRRDNHRAIFGDGIPVHISSWGDGDLPSACRTGVVSQCAFGGTSAATPYTAGVFGTVLSEIRRVLGDVRAGQKAHQVVAEGIPVAGSPYLSDGKLTRAELREAVLKTAEPLNTENAIPDAYVHPVWVPYVPMVNVLFEGYGAATPNSAKRAIDVLLGKTPLPDRSFEDTFFSIDSAIKNALYGGYDHNGDGTEDTTALPQGMHVSRADVSTYVGTLRTIQRALRLSAASAQPAAAKIASVQAAAVAAGSKPVTYYLHRLYSDPETPPSDKTPGLLPPIPPSLGIFIPSTTTVRCSEANNIFFMTPQDTKGDLDPCFNSRVSSVIANFRPLGIWPSTKPLTAPLPAGSTVHVVLYMAGETPSIVRPTGVLVATDREIGTGAPLPSLLLPTGINGSLCDALGDACWTKYDFSFTTTRPAFTGEELTFQVQLLGARSWAFGYEGNHTSSITVTPAAMPSSGLSFGVTIAPQSAAGAGQKVVVGGTVKFPELGEDPSGAGDHPSVRTVQVAIDDPSFATANEAFVDEKTGTWRYTFPLKVPAGPHTAYVRAVIDRTYSAVASTAVRVGGVAQIQWQLVKAGGAVDPGAWKEAAGFGSWSFTFTPSDTGTVVVRAVVAGQEMGRTTFPAKASGQPTLPATGLGDPGTVALVLFGLAFAAAWIRRERIRE